MAASKAWKRGIAEKHIKALCRSRHIAIRWVNGPKWMDKAESSEKARLVHIPRPYTPQQYLVALHEIGHIEGKITWYNSDEYRDWGIATIHLVIEASADAWAMEHIHPELLHTMRYEHVEKTAGVGMAHHIWSVACADLSA